MSPRKGPPLGAHTTTAGGVSAAIRQGAALGCDVVQVFTRNQRQWRARPLDPAEIARWEALVAETGVRPAMAHCSYLVNLCATDPATLARSRGVLLDEVDRADALGIPFVVLHPGAHLGAGVEAGIAKIARSLDWVARRRPEMRATICLEGTAGQGTNLGRTFEELAAIIAAAACGDRLGVCLDTCHLFAAGYDIRTAAGWRETMRRFDRVVGLERLRCMHLNDAKVPLGSRKDRHENIGEGTLGLEAFRPILRDRRMRDVPMALETPYRDKGQGYARELALLRGLL